MLCQCCMLFAFASPPLSPRQGSASSRCSAASGRLKVDVEDVDVESGRTSGEEAKAVEEAEAMPSREVSVGSGDRSGGVGVRSSLLEPLSEPARAICTARAASRVAIW